MPPQLPGRRLAIRLRAELALALVDEVSVDVVVVHSRMVGQAAKGVLSAEAK